MWGTKGEKGGTRGLKQGQMGIIQGQEGRKGKKAGHTGKAGHFFKHLNNSNLFWVWSTGAHGHGLMCHVHLRALSGNGKTVLIRFKIMRKCATITNTLKLICDT